MISAIVCVGMIIIGIIYQSYNKAPVFVDEVNNEQAWCGTIGLNKRDNITFKQNCASCHKLDKDATGPKLTEFLNVVKNENWVKSFLKNEDSLIAIQDSLVGIINKKGTTMEFSHSFESLSDNELQGLINLMK